VRVSDPTRDADWDAISAILDDMEQVLAEAGDSGRSVIADLRNRLALGQRASVLTQATSGDMWNHMGSFFDRSLSDRSLDRRFRRGQIRLADELEAGGVATSDIRSWTAILLRWDADGV